MYMDDAGLSLDVVKALCMSTQRAVNLLCFAKCFSLFRVCLGVGCRSLNKRPRRVGRVRLSKQGTHRYMTCFYVVKWSGPVLGERCLGNSDARHESHLWVPTRRLGCTAVGQRVASPIERGLRYRTGHQRVLQRVIDKLSRNPQLTSEHGSPVRLQPRQSKEGQEGPACRTTHRGRRLR